MWVFILIDDLVHDCDVASNNALATSQSYTEPFIVPVSQQWDSCLVLNWDEGMHGMIIYSSTVFP